MTKQRLISFFPFHLFRHEKELELFENDEERLEELKETYRLIMEYLDRKLEEERLTALQRWVIQETTKKVAENLAMNYEKVAEGVTEIMGGQVIELECVKQWNAGKAEGRTDGLSVLVKTLKSLLNDFDKVYYEVIKNEIYADVTREQVMKYYT